jgi:nucleotide-binding universal stress UspA family protein
MLVDRYKLQMAIRDFHSARQRASIQEVLARLTGRSTQLLSYEEVAEKLRLRVRTERGLQHIPLDAIVGSVGRYTDFTRTFLPRHADDQERWTGVRAAFLEEGAGLPPIEVYKVGEAYFVIDGNHRVSIARQEKFKTIEAHVIEVRTSVPLTPQTRPEDLIIKAEYAEFLDVTRLMDLRPNVDLSVTIPGQYQKLIQQICAQECLLEREAQSNIPFQQAVEDWYDTIYIPLAEAIRDRGLLRWFPDRTITDLYLWIAENRSRLEEELGWEIHSDIAATDLILKKSTKSRPGTWRKSRTVMRYTDNLFMDVLVPLSGTEESWDSLEQAIFIARQEGARLHGLHIVDTKERAGSSASQDVKARFDGTCKESGVEGNLVIEVGDVTRKICERAVLTDLIVVKITHPPSQGLSVLRSPFRTMIENASRPVLAVPGKASPFKRALLAYDGTERSKEAVFVAAYLAEMWKTELIVFTAVDAYGKADRQDYVRRYLDIHEVEATYILSERGAMDHLKKSVEEHDVDLLLMGSHGVSMLQQVFSGSALDYMLRESRLPIFICR